MKTYLKALIILFSFIFINSTYASESLKTLKTFECNSGSSTINLIESKKDSKVSFYLSIKGFSESVIESRKVFGKMVFYTSSYEHPNKVLNIYIDERVKKALDLENWELLNDRMFSDQKNSYIGYTINQKNSEGFNLTHQYINNFNVKKTGNCKAL